ncbi:MAG TPA: tyrosine-type recombinase/integrase [Streptosporangiaceae bacterium]
MLGQDPGSSGVTFGEAWTAWLAGKRKLRQSARARLEQIGAHWLIPAIGDVPLERLSGVHCAAVFQRIEHINAGIRAQQGDGRAFVHVDGDVRDRPRPVGVASQHRVYAALREFANFEVRKTRRLAFNPAYAVELEQEITPEATRWSAAQARKFLAATAGDPLHPAYRLVLLRGLRRGEALGLRWADADLDAGFLRIRQTSLKIGGEVVTGRPKSKAGERVIWLDQQTTDLLKAHHDAQVLQALEADTAWQDHDLLFCKEDGQPLKPDAVSRHFKVLARKAGLPPIKLHEGRHSAASLARDAAVDPEIRRRTLGHADQAMTSHYTHIEQAARQAAAEAVARLVEGDGS